MESVFARSLGLYLEKVYARSLGTVKLTVAHTASGTLDHDKLAKEKL